MDNIIDKSAMLQEEPACLHKGEIHSDFCRVIKEI